MGQSNTPIEPSYRYTEREMAIFAETFFSDEPDGFYVEPSPDKDQITVREVHNGFVFPVR